MAEEIKRNLQRIYFFIIIEGELHMEKAMKESSKLDTHHSGRICHGLEAYLWLN